MHKCPQCGYNPNTDTLDDVHFVYAEQMVYRHGCGVKLSGPEMDLFEALYDGDGRGCSTEQLIHALYGHKLDCDLPDDLHTNTYVYISKVRSKMRKLGLFISHVSRGRYAGRYRLTKMRPVDLERNRLEAAE